MTKKQINEAAKAYAKEQLGEDQFKSNKDAVKAISDDFKAGVEWVLFNSSTIAAPQKATEQPAPVSEKGEPTL